MPAVSLYIIVRLIFVFVEVIVCELIYEGGTRYEEGRHSSRRCSVFSFGMLALSLRSSRCAAGGGPADAIVGGKPMKAKLPRRFKVGGPVGR